MRYRSAWIIAGGLVLAGVIVAVAVYVFRPGEKTAAPAPVERSAEPRYGLTGTLTVDGEWNNPADCSGVAYAPVEVLAGDSLTVLARTTTAGDQVDQYDCSVSFSLEIPEARLYHITIGERDGPTYTFQQLQAAEFHLDLTVRQPGS